MKPATAAPERYTPTVAQLDEARKRFWEYEPRDLFYRVASELIELALTGGTNITVAEALAVLLQTWNAQYYQFRPFTLEHFANIEALLQKHMDDALRCRSRSIESVGKSDLPLVESLFNGFEHRRVQLLQAHEGLDVGVALIQNWFFDVPRESRLKSMAVGSIAASEGSTIIAVRCCSGLVQVAFFVQTPSHVERGLDAPGRLERDRFARHGELTGGQHVVNFDGMLHGGGAEA